MDIGDVNEIPTTRRKLPSMQELGAFDFDAPSPGSKTVPPALYTPPITVAAPALAAETAAPADAALADAMPAARPRATGEQLRVALAKADPQTRKRLLRLIAGGRNVQQRGEPSPQPVGKPSVPLLMALQRPVPQPAPAPSVRRATSSRAEPPAAEKPAPRADRSDRAERPLLQIDGNTDLLEALPPPVDAEQRKAALLAQLAEAKTASAAPPARPASHKVLFPAYDPREHGEDVHRPGRKGDGPVEGHFPAPRQPFQPSYRHADGRLMDEEETRVEEVLQEQRCEQTLEVLARDGVNGLLLSPRDLDAAVDHGVLGAATAALLWKTWSALRPVIHVIEDDPPPAATARTTAGAAASGQSIENPPLPGVIVEAAAAPLSVASGTAAGLDGPVGEQAPGPLSVGSAAVPQAESVRGDGDAAQALQPRQTSLVASKAPSIEDASVLSGTTSLDPAASLSSGHAAPSASGDFALPHAPIERAGGRFRQRIVRWSRVLGRIFVLGCVISSSAQIAWWIWRNGGYWLLP